jgi:non-structural maintenance of chromosomes element 4
MIFDLLEDLEPINFFKFVVHPQSFSQTVENLFYLSFLIRDAKAYVHVDDNNDLILGNSRSNKETAEPPTPEQLQDPEFVKMQNILHLDMATWRVRY